MLDELLMNKRLKYLGGNREERLIQSKLNSMKSALFNSYQAATIQLSDGREFKCLINRDKLKPNYDNKIISIPYKDIELSNKKAGEKTIHGQETIGLKCGDTFLWKETNTHWIVYLEIIDEDAYFRAEIRKCELEIEINKNKYWVYRRGPVETTIPWSQKHEIMNNTPNYSLELYITKNDETLKFFERFRKIKIDGHNWMVKVVNPYYANGILEIYVGEDYDNTILDEAKKEAEFLKSQEEVEEKLKGQPQIKGLKEVFPYDYLLYTAEWMDKGDWVIDNEKIYVIEKTDKYIRLQVRQGKSGSFNLTYKRKNEQDIIFPVKILTM